MVLFAVFFTGCSSNEYEDTNHFDYLKNKNLKLHKEIDFVVKQYDENVNILREEITKTKNCSEFYSNYRKLSHSEKADLWKDKLIFVLKTSDLSEKQYDLLLEAFFFIEPDMFVDGSKANIYAKEVYAPLWEKKSLLYFSDEEIINIVISLSDYTISKNMSKDSEPPRVCTCSQRSFSFGCRDTGCSQTGSGCGWFGLFRCDGNRL